MTADVVKTQLVGHRQGWSNDGTMVKNGKK